MKKRDIAHLMCLGKSWIATKLVTVKQGKYILNDLDTFVRLTGKQDREEAKYRKGFNIMMDYFNEISDEVKPEVDKRLKKVGL